MLQLLVILQELLDIMNDPKVSVCMIVYNHEDYLEDAIKGVLAQKTNFDVEFIISNDASTDNSEKVILKLIEENNAIKVNYINHTKNKGMIKNFIFSLEKCKGKYIALCEGDDYWTDSLKLQKQVDFMEANSDYSGCFHDTLIKFEENPNAALQPWRVYDKQTFSVFDTISRTSLFHTTSFFFKRKLLNIPNWFVRVQSSDMALFTLIANEGLIHRIDDSMSVYRKHEGGITNIISLLSYHKNRILLFKHLRGNCKPKTHSKIKEVIGYHQTELMKLQKQTFKNRLKKLLKL